MSHNNPDPMIPTSDELKMTRYATYHEPQTTYTKGAISVQMIRVYHYNS